MADNDVNKVLASSAGNSDVLTRKYFESLAIEMRLLALMSLTADLIFMEMNFRIR